MKSFLYIAMTALIFTSCASKRPEDLSTKQVADQERQEQFSRHEANSYRVR